MDYENILKYGKLNYSQLANNIICDRCFKSNINTCISFENKDLCLVCVEKISKNISMINNNNLLTKTNSDIYKPCEVEVKDEIVTVFDFNLKCIYNDICVHEIIVNNIKLILDGHTIKKKYWTYLKPNERKHLIYPFHQ